MSFEILKQLDERVKAVIERTEQLRQENARLAEQLEEGRRRFEEISANLKQVEQQCQEHENERSGDQESDRKAVVSASTVWIWRNLMANVSVEIMGQNLVVASDSDADWVRAVARAVDERSRTIRAKARNINAVDLAILTALNFADELERLRIEYRELLEQIDALSQRLSESFEENG